MKRLDFKRYCTFNNERVVNCSPPAELIDEISSTVRDGGLIVYPTDTIYCIGADIFDEHAVKKVFTAKQRPFDMPLAVSVSSRKMAMQIANLNRVARKLMESLMPGPLIILAEKKGDVPDLLTAGGSTVGLRIPDHPLARTIIDACGPITSASANRHSKPEPSTVEQPFEEFGKEIDIYIDCGRTLYGRQSTIVDTTDANCPVVRKGPVNEERIREVLSSD